MKTANDYLAEYVREKRPEIEHSQDFIFWRLGRQISDTIHGFVDAVTNAFVKEEVSLLEDLEDDEMS